jgi:hypothetical protein
MTGRFWIAGLAGAVAMFVWMSVAHTTPALATAGIQRLPDEPMVLASLQNGLGERRGLFLYPYLNPRETGAADRRLAASPSGLLIYRPPGGRAMEPRQLLAEFVLELFECLAATALLSMTVLSGFVRRVGFFAGLGVLAAVVTNGSYWIWYGFPAAYSLTAMLVEFVKFVAAGAAVALVFAWSPTSRKNATGPGGLTA